MSIRHREGSEIDVGGAADTLATIDAAQSVDSPLHAARDFATQDPEHPLERKIVMNLSATLEDLSLKNKPLMWAPTAASTKKILQQSKYTDLAGSQERTGDLKSVVLHKITLDEVKSTFPVSTGLRITGVDENTFSSTGEAFSTIVMPKHSSTAPKVLQEDDVAAAYAFAERFPGYTAQNLSTKGIHDVTSRNFCLVASDHPICAAIKENASSLQASEISCMPEGLVKISSSMYNAMAPAVRAQVASQLKVKDMSEFSVSASPADHRDWKAAREALVSRATASAKAAHAVRLTELNSEDEKTAEKATFRKSLRDIESIVDATPIELSAAFTVQYNFLSE